MLLKEDELYKKCLDLAQFVDSIAMMGEAEDLVDKMLSLGDKCTAEHCEHLSEDHFCTLDVCPQYT